MKKRYQILFVLILLAFCILIFPIFYNLVDILGLGHYNSNGDFNNSFAQGTGGVNVNFNLELTHDDIYFTTVNFNIITSGLISPVGIIQIDYSIYIDDQLKIICNESFNPPSNSFQKTYYNLQFSKFDLIIFRGKADVRFLEDSIEKDEIIDYELSILIITTSAEISNDWELVRIWLDIFDICAVICLVIVLSKIIRKIKFEKWYTEEERKNDEEFFKKMRNNRVK